MMAARGGRHRIRVVQGMRARRKERAWVESTGNARPRPRRGVRALVASRVFAGVMGLWGALLGALVVMVVPPALLHSLAPAPAITGLGLAVQPTLAGAGALGLGMVCFALAALLSIMVRRRQGPQPEAWAGDSEVELIDPLRDLGLASLGNAAGREPIPSIDWQAWRKDAVEAGRTGEDPLPEEPRPEPVQMAPRREPRSVPPAARHGTAALSLLRSVPTSELSMPEMVERFAAALHQHRSGTAAIAPLNGEIAARQAALAEALKGLATLSNGAAPLLQEESRTMSVREALDRLGARLGG